MDTISVVPINEAIKADTINHSQLQNFQLSRVVLFQNYVPHVKYLLLP